ncbi:MAG: TolC family protein [Verrucomicrobiota bacterium]
MKKGLRFWTLCALLGCVGFGAAGQTNAPARPTGTNQDSGMEELSLARAKEIAFEKNWDLLAAKSGIDAATAQLIVAKEFPNPTASLSIAKIGTHDSATSMGNGVWDRNYDSIAAVSQLIEIAGKRHDRQVAGRAGVIGAKARFYDAKRILDQGVTKAYIAALLAGENVRILNQSADLLLKEAKIAEDRNKAGDLSVSDMRQIEINAEQFGLQAKSAEAAAVQARIGVEILMGVPRPGGNWTPTESLDKLVGARNPPAAEAKPDAARPDVLAAEADLRGGKAQLQLQRATRIPDPTFTIGVEHNPPNSGPAVDTFLVGLSFPLPLWNRNGGNIQAAQASVDQFEEALGKVKTQAMADIANAQVEFDEAHKRWLLYRDVTAPKSEQVRESVEFAYKKGGAALVDLLNAEQTDNTIRLALAQAMSDTSSAIADLEAAQNVLTETELDARKK